MIPIQPGKKFKLAMSMENPLQIVGVINAMAALLAKSAEFHALYLSGAGVANAQYGLPDLGLTSMAEVVEEARRITSVSGLPLLVDGDTGFGSALTIERTVKELMHAGAAAVHFEDQVFPKRCGHRDHKSLVSSSVMCDRIKTAVDARLHPDFVIMARTDAIADEGMTAAIARSVAYQEAGADMIFVEAVTDINQYKAFSDVLKVPILANMTEFGKTPLYSVAELKAVGVQLVLYPLSGFRAMNKAALSAFQAIKVLGTQHSIVDKMQTRDELYALLHYYDYEKKID